MKYVGSKARIAKHIAPIIQSYIDKGVSLYIEPFVGGANVIEHIVCSLKVGFDNNMPLIALLTYVIEGGGLPSFISRDDYNAVKANPDKYPMWYVGAVGFLASYNGKFFGGYAGIVHTKAGTVRNYYDEAKRNLEAQVLRLRGSKLILKSYDYLDIDKYMSVYHREKWLQGQAVIYADPPYDGVTGYAGLFNSKQFWETCRAWAANGNTVLVSELAAPIDFTCIWESPVTRTLRHDGRSKAIEKLFIYKG